MEALSTRFWRAAVVTVASGLIVACAGMQPPGVNGPNGASGCAGLEASQCGRAQGLVKAASGFGNVRHEYLLDAASSIAPGRGIQRAGEGAYSILPTRCAQERSGPAGQDGKLAPSVDASTIDFTYVGVAVDQHLVSADADLTPWLSAGAEGSEKKISLVALAFVRDLDPQFFGASEDVAYGGEGCTCGRATHFVGSVKMGGALSYEMTVRAGEVHGRALEFFKARLAASDARITQTVAGGLEVEGLEAAVGGMSSAGAAGAAGTATAKPLTFRVKNPVPVAYALYPLSDVCKFAFPAPEVVPEVVDFGDVPYGKEETRLVHIVNRASIDLRATLGERTFAVPALGSADVPMTWRPEGDTLGCQNLTREETIQFSPRDADVPVTPRTHSVRLTARVRTGKPTFRRQERIDTGVHRKPDYEATKREWECQPGYALAACRTENAQCGDGRCGTEGYAVNAEPLGNGCRFRCNGPDGLLPGISSMFCRFDAVMDCRLRCP